MNLIKELTGRIDRAQLWQKTICLKRNEFLKVKGSADTNLYYVLSGSLRIFIEDEFEEHTIRLAYQNDLIAALDAFITEQPSELYIQAIKKCELKVISKLAFMEFIKSDAEHLQLWYKLLEQLIYQQLEREKDILIYSPMERYKRVLQRSPALFQEIPGKYIASYLRMSPETLSRLKKS